MIKVSIAENIQIAGFKVNEYGGGVVSLVQKKDFDMFAALNEGSSIEGDETADVTVWPVKVTNYQGEPLTGEAIVNEFRKQTAKLGHLISLSLPESEIKWNMFADTGITTIEQINTEIVKEEVAAKINSNIFEQFAAMLAKADLNVKFRIKLPRQSAAKHFPTIPNYLGFMKTGKTFYTPFIESASIPKEQSKLAWSKYEEERGLNNPNPVNADAGPSGTADLPFEV